METNALDLARVRSVAKLSERNNTMKTKVERGYYHNVRSDNGCTVTQIKPNGETIVDEIPAGETTAVFAFSSEFDVSDNTAVVQQVFNSAPIAGSGGGSSSGERVSALTGAELPIRHATWFNNADQTAISVQPAAWQDRVLTCYLKTEVPVSLSGVNWLYGEPAMMEGFSFVIALQQVDASTVLANLAYTIKQ